MRHVVFGADRLYPAIFFVLSCGAAAAQGGTITFTGAPEGTLTLFNEAGFRVFPDSSLEFYPSILPEGNPAPALGNYESGLYTVTRIRDTCGGLFRFVRADYASPTYPQSVVRVGGYLGPTFVYQQTLAGLGGTWPSTSNALISELQIHIEKGEGPAVWVDNIELTIVDCNGNGISDGCELAEHDCNGNGVPDDCELAGHDCNTNGTLDSCDIDSGAIPDCNANRTPDDCEPDCNNTGIPDACDVDDGTSADCNGNHIPDECETDCNENDIPDGCDLIIPVPYGYSVSPHLAIPVSPAGVSSTIIVPDGGMVTDVDVGLFIRHWRQGDLMVTLSHGGVTRRLINRAGLSYLPNGYPVANFGSSTANLLVLDDSAPATFDIDTYDYPNWYGIEGFAGPAIPSASLSLCRSTDTGCIFTEGPDFKGLDARGPWTLTVFDLNSDPGVQGPEAFLETWRLDVKSPVAADCNGNGILDQCEADCNANGIADLRCDFFVPFRNSYGLSPNVSIPLQDPTGISSTIVVPDGGAITDLNVGLHINHNIQGDVVVKLSHAGVTRTLINRPGHNCFEPFGYEGNDFGSAGNLLLLDDTAVPAIDCYAGSEFEGTYQYAGPARPSEALSAFHGLNAAGPWTLTVIDSGVPIFTGRLAAWRLDLEIVSGDCNSNGHPDECDIAEGASDNCNADTIPDTCQLTVPPPPHRYSLNPNVQLPDYGIFRSVIDVSDVGVITDVKVALHIQHPRQSALFVWLQGPGSPEVGLFFRPGACTGDSFPLGYTADNLGSAGNPLILRSFPNDSAAVSMNCYAGGASTGINNYAGPARPDQSLSLLNGRSPAGQWTLSVFDVWGDQIGGTLVSWGLDIEIGRESADCNHNSSPDDCDIDEGDSADCNTNLLPDECDVANGVADCNTNGIPDLCEPDCNLNDVADECDISVGESEDCNGNHTLDECEHDLFFDWNSDYRNDLTDHPFLVDCLGGPEAPPGNADCFDLCLAAFDYDDDGDVDLVDVNAFYELFDR